MDMNETHSRDAECRVFTHHYGVVLDLVIQREILEVVKMEMPFWNLSEPAFNEQIKSAIEVSKDSMPTICLDGSINTSPLLIGLTEANIHGHSTYHNSTSNGEMKDWYIQIADNSSVFPSLELCRNGVDNVEAIESLASWINAESGIEEAKIITELKAQMSTMKL